MNRSADTKSKYLLIPAAGVLCAGLLALALYLEGITIGSEHTLLMFDMNEQFAAFFASLRYLWQDGNSFWYSFNGGLGSNYMGLYAYYLSGPLSWIPGLWPLQGLPDGIYVMVLIKTALCGSTFAYYLLRTKRLPAPVTLALSLAYGLMSYSVIAGIIPMYLDGVMMLPIVMLGVRKIAEEGKITPFAVSLGLAVVLNYYTAYMIAGFSVLYLLWYRMTVLSREMEQMTEESEDCSFEEVEDSGIRRALAPGSVIGTYVRLCLGGLLGLGLSAPLLLPVIMDLLGGKGKDPGTYSDGRFLVHFPHELVKQFFPDHYDSLYSAGLPALYCSIAVLLLALLYFALSGKKRRRGMLAAAVILVILLLSLCLRPLYRVWHGFRDPVAYPGRFAFLIGFFLCVLAAEGWELLETRYLSGKSKALPGICATLICLLTIPELTLNARTQYESMRAELSETTRTEYAYFLDVTIPELEALGEFDREGGFYRTEKDYQLCTNDGQLLGMRGLSFFSSTYTQDFLDFLKSLGLLQYHYKSYEIGATPLTDSLFGIRYKLCHSAFPDWYLQIGAGSYSKSVINPGALSLGYLVDPDGVYAPGADPFRNQELLLSAMTMREEHIYAEIPFASEAEYVHDRKIRGELYSGLLWTMTFEGTGAPVYLNFDLLKESDLTFAEKDHSPEIRVYVDGAETDLFIGYQRSYNMYLGTFDAGEAVSLAILGAGEERTPHLVAFNTDALAQGLSTLAAGELTDVTASRGTITGRIGASRDGICLLTLPYDRGFSALVDGKEVSTVPYAGALLGVPVTAGEHTLELRYLSPGFVPGCVLCGMSILLLILGRWIFIHRSVHENSKKV
ncbi:MAG: YfhO family protein [Lachnospiraceae bacterium]|nr:YfhO family protein [Lachnospiraceae bacterium]